jgi:hypothetical protein
MNAQTAVLTKDITPLAGDADAGDYEKVRRVIEKISLDYRDQPSLDAWRQMSAKRQRACKSCSPAGRV